MKFQVGAFAAAVVLALSASGAAADQLVMDNGSVIVGTLVSSSDQEVVFNTPFAGDIRVQQVNVVSITTDSGVDVLLKDGSLHRQRAIATLDDRMVLNGDERPVALTVADIDMLNPEPWQLGLGYHWTGRIDSGFESERGNGDTDELDLTLESIWQGYLNRYTLRGNWEIDETNNERNRNRWSVRGKYDRFASKDLKNYLGFQVAFAHEEFQDLDLRRTVGPYVGRQFYEERFIHLHGEVGVVYVEEDFKLADDRDYWGANWEFRASSEPLTGFQFYANQEGIADFNNLDEVILKMVAGLRFPTLFGLASAAEAVWEYDGGAVEGVNSTDETYRFKVGYNW